MYELAVQNKILASMVIPNSIYSSTIWVLVLNLPVNAVKSTGGRCPFHGRKL
jgi:hypothetical protein